MRSKKRSMCMRTVCPGCGGSTTEPGHLVRFDKGHQAVLLYCPRFDEWYKQHTLFGVERVLPSGQQLGLM